MSVHSAYRLLFETPIVEFPPNFTDDGYTPLSWRVYVRPTQAEDVDACSLADEQNLRIWLDNRKCGLRFGQLLEQSKIGSPTDLLGPPKSYIRALQEQVLGKIRNDEHYRTLVAIYYLKEHEDMQVFVDYQPRDANDIAEKKAMWQEVERRCSYGPVYVLAHQFCGCRGKWDGRSSTCIMDVGTIRWERDTGFTFASPLLKIHTER